MRYYPHLPCQSEGTRGEGGLEVGPVECVLCWQLVIGTCYGQTERQTDKAQDLFPDRGIYYAKVSSVSVLSDCALSLCLSLSLSLCPLSVSLSACLFM